MSNYSKVNFIYFLQKWMDSVAGQTFLNYAYSWGAAIVILGTLFKLTHLPGANAMLFIGMGTEVIVFFISAFDRPFDKTTIDMTLDNHMSDNISINGDINPESNAQAAVTTASANGNMVVAANGSANAANGTTVIAGNIDTNSNGGAMGNATVISGNTTAGDTTGGTIIIGGGFAGNGGTNVTQSVSVPQGGVSVPENVGAMQEVAADAEEKITFATSGKVPTGAPAPAVSQETAEAMEDVTKAYIVRLNELNEIFEKVAALSSRLATDSEEMENLNRTLTGISRVYEMQLKSASQQITTQDEINEQTRKMAQQIQELNAIYARMIEAMTTNMPGKTL